MQERVFEEFKRYICNLLERSQRTIHAATDDLNDEGLYYQPTKETNSIAWLAWHLSRRREYYSSKIHGEAHLWATDGWAERFGMDPGGSETATGSGHTLEQVAAFRPARDLLFGYVDAAYEVAVDRISRLELEMMDKEYELDGNRGMQTGWTVVLSPVNDGLIHTGQIAYLRGMITGFGWQRY